MNYNNISRKIIAIEGLDGAGKSTQIELLCNTLSTNNIEYTHIHFPKVDTPPYGSLIAEFLRGEFGPVNQVHPKLVSLLFALDRHESRKEILTSIEQGKTVILDRYVYSNIAFQCAKLNLESDKEKLKRWILDYEYNYLSIPKPNFSFFLDMPIQFVINSLSKNREGTSRNYLNGRVDIHESSIDLQTKVLLEYQRLSKNQDDIKSIRCFDTATNSPLPAEHIHKEIMSKISEL